MNDRSNIFEQGLRTYLNEEQLSAIQSVKIGIGGAGGLGSNIALLLVRSGFTQLELLDHDLVEPSNLNRQQFVLTDIGRPKVKALSHHLLKINPSLTLTLHQEHWALENAAESFCERDVVIEAFDNAHDKKNFVEFYQDKADLVVCGSGLAGTNMSQTMEVTRLGNVFIVGDKTSETSSVRPPFSPRVTQCAAMMAGSVLEWVLKNKIRKFDQDL